MAVRRMMMISHAEQGHPHVSSQLICKVFSLHFLLGKANFQRAHRAGFVDDYTPNHRELSFLLAMRLQGAGCFAPFKVLAGNCAKGYFTLLSSLSVRLGFCIPAIRFLSPIVYVDENVFSICVLISCIVLHGVGILVRKFLHCLR